MKSSINCSDRTASFIGSTHTSTEENTFATSETIPALHNKHSSASFYIWSQISACTLVALYSSQTFRRELNSGQLAGCWVYDYFIVATATFSTCSSASSRFPVHYWSKPFSIFSFNDCTSPFICFTAFSMKHMYDSKHGSCIYYASRTSWNITIKTFPCMLLYPT